MGEKWTSKCTVDHKWYFCWLLTQLYCTQLWFGSNSVLVFCHWWACCSFCDDHSQEHLNSCIYRVVWICVVPLFYLHHAIGLYSSWFYTMRNWPEVSSFMRHLLWADLFKYHLKHLLCRLFFNIANSEDHNKAVIPWDKSSFILQVCFVCVCLFFVDFIYKLHDCVVCSIYSVCLIWG